MEDHVRLEHEFGRWAGVENVVACSSGTAALHLAFEAFDLPPGSEVVVPDYSMIACARAVVLASLKPIFVDCRRSDLNIDPVAVEEAITPRTRAVLAVHTYGRPADTPALADLCRKFDLYLVEDLAEAHGAPPDPACDAACHSFYRNKIVYGEEGGAVSFKDAAAAKEARCLRSLGFDDEHDYWHKPRGHNYRMSPSHARLVIDCLGRMPFELGRRTGHVDLYEGACPGRLRQPRRTAQWVYDVRLPGLTPVRQRRLVDALRAIGVPARHGFKPLRLQPEFSGLSEYALRSGAGVQPSAFEADVASSEVVYLGIGQTDPGLDAGRVSRVMDVIRRAAGGG